MIIQYLSAALNQRHLLGFNYDGKPRIVEPHALGVNADGKTVVRGWQQNGDRPGWRLFVLEKAETITVIDGTNISEAPRPGYKLDDSAMVTIHAQLPIKDDIQVEEAA